MNKGIFSIIAIACIAWSPARASELGVIIDKQFGSSVSFFDPQASYDSASMSGVGLRGVYTVGHFGKLELGVSGTYHLKTQDNMTYHPAWTTIGSTTPGAIASEYLAVGVEVDYTTWADLHFGLDLRQEKISTSTMYFPMAYKSTGLPTGQLESNPSGSDTITRPWIKVGIGHTFLQPGLSPFIRLEIAYALGSYTLPSDYSNGDNPDDYTNLCHAMAPKYQIGFYGGVRF